MAYSSAALTGDELTAHEMDLPFFVGTHAFRDAHFNSSSPQNPWSTTGRPFDSDAAATGFPTYRAWDGHGHLITKPNSDQNTWYYSIGGLGGVDIDTVLVIIDTRGSLRTIKVQTADNDAFTSNVVDLVTFDAPPETYAIGVWENDDAQDHDQYTRLTHAFLGHTGSEPRRYSNVDRIRVYLDYPFLGSGAPQLCEVWLGRRRAFRFLGVPMADKGEMSTTVGRVGGFSGFYAGTTHHRGKASRSLTIDLEDADDLSTFESFWDETNHGTRNFLYVENPNSGPTAYVMNFSGDVHQFNPVLLKGASHRRMNLDMIESAPHASGY